MAARRPRYADRGDAPRDLRTSEELAANGYTRLGEPCAELAPPDSEPVLLYSTSEARRLKHDLWPRGSGPVRTGAPVDVADTPYGGSKRSANPGASSAARPGAAGTGRRAARFGRTAAPLPALGDPQEWLSQLFADGFVVLDTETTGLGPHAEIIEIAAVDHAGEVLVESKVWPRSGRVPPAASRIHGLSVTDLRGAPSWPELLLQLERKLAGRRVLAWNAPFDQRMTQQTSRLWSLAPQLPAFECAMRAYAHVRGVGRSSMRLERAAQVERVLTSAQEHRSLDDARLVLAVLRRLQEARTVPA